MWRAFWTWAGARIGGYRAQGRSILEEGKHQDGNKPRELMDHENSAVRAECYPIMGTRFGKEARLWRTLVESGWFKVGIKMFQTLLTSLPQWTSDLLHFKYIFYLNTRGLTKALANLLSISCARWAAWGWRFKIRVSMALSHWLSLATLDVHPAFALCHLFSQTGLLFPPLFAWLTPI